MPTFRFLFVVFLFVSGSDALALFKPSRTPLQLNHKQINVVSVEKQIATVYSRHGRPLARFRSVLFAGDARFKMTFSKDLVEQASESSAITYFMIRTPYPLWIINDALVIGLDWKRQKFSEREYRQIMAQFRDAMIALPEKKLMAGTQSGHRFNLYLPHRAAESLIFEREDLALTTLSLDIYLNELKRLVFLDKLALLRQKLKSGAKQGPELAYLKQTIDQLKRIEKIYRQVVSAALQDGPELLLPPQPELAKALVDFLTAPFFGGDELSAQRADYFICKFVPGLGLLALKKAVEHSLSDRIGPPVGPH